MLEPDKNIGRGGVEAFDADFLAGKTGFALHGPAVDEGAASGDAGLFQCRSTVGGKARLDDEALLAQSGHFPGQFITAWPALADFEISRTNFVRARLHGEKQGDQDHGEPCHWPAASSGRSTVTEYRARCLA